MVGPPAPAAPAMAPAAPLSPVAVRAVAAVATMATMAATPEAEAAPAAAPAQQLSPETGAVAGAVAGGPPAAERPDAASLVVSPCFRLSLRRRSGQQSPTPFRGSGNSQALRHELRACSRGHGTLLRERFDHHRIADGVIHCAARARGASPR